MKLQILRRKVQDNTKEAFELSSKINLEGSTKLINRLAQVIPEGFNFIFFSSLWSSFYGQVAVPQFYEPIAATKNLFEGNLVTSRRVLESQRIYTAIVSGSILRDTDLGQTFARVANEVDGAVEGLDFDSFPTTEDMVEASIRFLTTDPKNWNEAKLYVIKPGVIVDHLAQDWSGFNSIRVNF